MRDHRVMHIVGVVLVILALGYAGTWFYMRQQEQISHQVNYMNMPIAVSRGGFSVAATFAIKTNGTNAKWAMENRRALEEIMKRVLLETDPQRALAPNGLVALQETVRASCNIVLQTDKVQDVLITDFLVSEGDM